jgi:hypothetical protein
MNEKLIINNFMSILILNSTKLKTKRLGSPLPLKKAE